MLLQFIFLALIVFIAAMVQSTSGFGFGIIFMAIMPLLITYKHANFLSVATCLVLQIYVLLKLRHHLNFKLVIVPVIASLISSSIGVRLMVNINPHLMNFILGFFLWTLAFYLIVIAKHVHLKKNIFVGFCAGAFGGLMEGLFAIGGPPMVAYYDSVISDPLEYQATIQTYFAITTINVVINNIICGNFTHTLVWPLLIAIIACIAGTTVGMHILKNISMQMIRKLAYTVMILAGTYDILKGIL